LAGTGVSVGGGGSGVLLGGTDVGGTGVFVAGMAVLVGGASVFVGGLAGLVGGAMFAGVFVGGTGALVGGTAVLVGDRLLPFPDRGVFVGLMEFVAVAFATRTRVCVATGCEGSVWISVGVTLAGSP
jgi:hypothetical protein